MNYFVLLIISSFTAQSLKYAVRLLISHNFSFMDMAKTFSYNSGFPSAHSTVLTSSLWYFRNLLGINNPLFQVLILMSYLWLFEIYMQRRRHNSSTEFFIDTLIQDKSQIKILKDLHGHSLIDILGGLILGSLIYWATVLI